MIAGDCEFTDEPGVMTKAGVGQFIMDAARVFSKDDAGLKPDGLVQAGWL